MKNKKIDQDSDHFFTALKISEEALSVLRNEGKETKFLDSYIINNKSSHKFIDSVTNPAKFSSILENYSKGDKSSEARKLKELLENRSRSFHRRKIALSASAASVAAVVILFFFLFQPYDEKPTIANSIPATSNVTVPTLILGNGSTVNLKMSIKDSIINDKAVIAIDEQEIRYTTVEQAQVDTNKLIIPSHFTYSIVLADGTEVLLNANSEFRYPVSFNGEKREVFLKGEAYFRVQKEARPFIVTTNDLSIKVYGTEFNINTNMRERIETILVEGSVGVTPKNGTELMMKPNEMLTYETANGETTLRQITTENYLGWVSGLFKCDNDKLINMLDRIALWYNVEFSYNNTKVVEQKVSLTFSRDTELESILKALEIITGVKFIKENQKKYGVE